MTSIKTTYRGHVITYGENSDEWYCYDIGDKLAASPSLSKIKARIDRIYLDQRKAASIEAFEIANHSTPTKTETTVIEYIEPIWDGGWNGRPRHLADHKVASVARRGSSEKSSRSERKLSEIMPNTPEALAAWDHFKELSDAARQASDRAREAYVAIPRLTTEDIAELMRIKQTEKDAPKAGDE